MAPCLIAFFFAISFSRLVISASISESAEAICFCSSIFGMTQTIPITVYTADCTGNASNCLYPNKIEIADEASAKLAFAKDLVCARYRNNYRSIDNFELSNALPGDCDNEHSDDPQDWVTAEDVADLFTDVPHVIHYSRHHMKQKGNKGPRPRFHVVLLIQPEQDAERYTALKQRLQAAFPFFDANAMDAARFLFGTGDPQVLYHPGTVTLNDFLDEMDGEQSFADLEYSIPEGSRNSTMSRIGARIIKRYGDTAEAKDLFFQAAQQCSPPLEDRELESIWAGKQRLYSKICNQPGYIPPDAYNSTDPVVWDTPIPFDEYDLPIFPVDALPSFKGVCHVNSRGGKLQVGVLPEDLLSFCNRQISGYIDTREIMKVAEHNGKF